MEFKTKILEECKRIIDEKLHQLTSALNDITESSNSESKSSAGDKHETGKAMAHIEQEKLSKQLSEVKTQKNELNKIPLVTSASKITAGSLVETDNGLFFIAVSIGKIKVNSTEVFVVSPQSPIGLALLELKGNSFELNAKKYTVLCVI